MDKIIQNSEFKKLHDNFISDKSRNNYYKLTCFLHKKTKEMRKQTSDTIKNLNTILTDDTGCLIYSSKQKNSYSNYTKGKIKYDDLNETTVINSAEKNGNSIKIFDNKIYYALKIGSVATIIYELLENLGLDDLFESGESVSEMIGLIVAEYGASIAIILAGSLLVILVVLFETGVI